MGVRYYDDALYEKIQSWVKDPNMRILKVDETKRLFQQRADLGDDKPITLPLIALNRDTSIEILNTNKTPLSYDGSHVGGNEKSTEQLNAIPIQVHYQLDIYTQKYIEGDEYLRNFIFQFINYPKLKITIPYNGSNIVHEAYIKLLSTVSDNSDITEKLFSDQFTRWTLQLELQDAYLFSVPLNLNYHVTDASLDIAYNNEITSEKLPIEDAKLNDKSNNRNKK